MDENQELLKNTLTQINSGKKYIILYSSYGYIKISEEDIKNNSLTIYRFIQYKNAIDDPNKLFHGFIYKDNIKDTIDLKVKYFCSKRNLVPFEKININSKINILIENLFLKEDPSIFPTKLNKNSQYKLYSCKTGLRELNTGYTFYENNISDNEILLYFPEPILNFSSTMKGKSIEVSQQGRTGFKINTDDPQYVLGNVGYNGGRHYFEIKLLTDPMIRSIVVGFGIKKDEKNLFTYDMSKFYGYILSDMKKTQITNGNRDQELIMDYGEVCLINDYIGVLYDCKDDGVNISFYRNRKNLGIAFYNLPKDLTYFPAIEMGLCGSKIQIYNGLDFPDN